MSSTESENSPGFATERFSPLAETNWRYVKKATLDDITGAEWNILNTQRARYQSQHQADQALRLLTGSRDDASFGYPVNMYRHALQSATMALRDALDEETVVVSLLHDIGFIVCPNSHGEFAAELMRPYVSDRSYWMLQRHAIFQEHHVHDHDGVTDRHRRERWRGHPHFQWTADWVARYDQNAQDANYDCAPIEEFVPLLRRLFAREPKEFMPQ